MGFAKRFAILSSFIFNFVPDFGFALTLTFTLFFPLILTVAAARDTQASDVSSQVFSKVTETELASALKKYQKISQLNVQFKQTKTLKDMDVALSSEGDLQWQLPDQVIYRITKPSVLKVTMNPKTIEIENGTGASATKQTIQTSSMPGDAEKRSLQAMVTWLKMDPTLLSRDYEIATNHASSFKFIPHDARNSPFNELVLQLDASGHVKKMNMSEKSGDHIEFAFEKPKIVYVDKTK